MPGGRGEGGGVTETLFFPLWHVSLLATKSYFCQLSTIGDQIIGRISMSPPPVSYYNLASLPLGYGALNDTNFYLVFFSVPFSQLYDTEMKMSDKTLYIHDYYYEALLTPRNLQQSS